MSDNKPRNADKQEKQVENKEQDTGAITPKTGLTKRNADFMFKLRKEIANSGLNNEKQEEAIHDTEKQLLDGQKSGQTARQIFGTPSERVEEIVRGPKKETVSQNDNYWFRSLDNALIFAALFSAMYAVMSMFQPQTIAKTPGPAGFLAIILTSAVGGLGMGYVYRVLYPDKKAPRPSLWKQIGMTVLAVLVWISCYTLFAALPSSINPLLPPAGYIAIAVITFGARWYLRRRYGITGGFI